MEYQARQITRSYLILTGLYTLSASLIWGVNTLFLLDAGLSIVQVFTVNAIFTGAMAIFEIPTGVLADTRGRRISFLLSIAILLVGTLGYVAAAQLDNNLLLFSFMSILLGLGFTFYSGAMEAWLVDALNDCEFSGALDDVFARSSMVSSAAMLIGSILGGVLGSWHLSVPFLARSALLAVVLVIAYLTMHDMGFTPRSTTLAQLPGEMGKIARSSITYGWQNRSVRLLIIASFVNSIFMAWGFYAWQPYFLELLGRDAPWVAGVIAALISLAMMAGNGIVEWEVHRGGRRTTMLISAAVLQTVAAVGVGLVTSFWLAVGLYLLVMLAGGVWGPVKQAYMHQRIPSEQRATVISFDSLVASGGSVFGQTSLGQLAERRSIASGYVIGGLTTILVWPVVLLLRRRGEETDTIVGEAGQNSACGAQGLPAITNLDSQAGTAFAAE